METNEYFLLRRVATCGAEWYLPGAADSKALTRIEKAGGGLLESRHSPAGKRQTHFRLTDVGREAVEVERADRERRRGGLGLSASDSSKRGES